MGASRRLFRRRSVPSGFLPVGWTRRSGHEGQLSGLASFDRSNIAATSRATRARAREHNLTLERQASNAAIDRFSRQEYVQSAIESRPRISSVPMTSPGCGAGLLVCCGRDHHHATVAYAAFGDDVIGEMLNVAGGSLQRCHLHAAVVVEMNVQRRQRQIVVAMEVLHQAL